MTTPAGSAAAMQDRLAAPTSALASFASELSFADLPPEVRDRALLCVLDALGCGLFASALPWCQIVTEFVAERAGPGPATIWGTSVRSTASGAALANGTAGHGFELDDLHPAGVHPGPLAVSVSLALGEELNANGKDVVTGLVAGYEVGCRVAMAMLKGHARAGFHAEGTVGTFVAVATAGRMLGLPPARMRHAFAIGGSFASGLLAAQEDGMVKRLHAGHAAQNGVDAARLAEKGFTGIADVLENSFGGFCKAMGGSAEDVSLLAGGLGSVWETARVGFKIYPACGGSHTALHATRQLLRDNAFAAEDVEAVTVRASSHAVLKVGAPYKPTSVAGAQMSLAFVLALMLRFGEIPLDQLTDAGIVDPVTVELAGRVRMEADPSVDAQGSAGRHACTVRIELRDGRVLTTTLAHRPGSEKMPVRADDVHEKFRSLAGQRLPDTQVAAIEEAVSTLPDRSHVDELTRLLAWPTG